LTDKSVVTTNFIRYFKVVESTGKIDCDNRFVGQGNRYICSENRFWSVGAQTKFSVGPTDFVFRCRSWRQNVVFTVIKILSPGLLCKQSMKWFMLLAIIFHFLNVTDVIRLRLCCFLPIFTIEVDYPDIYVYLSTHHPSQYIRIAKAIQYKFI
jgi:hypothetical protein